MNRNNSYQYCRLCLGLREPGTMIKVLRRPDALCRLVPYSTDYCISTVVPFATGACGVTDYFCSRCVSMRYLELKAIPLISNTNQ